MNSEGWYKEAEKQTFETLPTFIKNVQKEFPGYEALNGIEFKNWEERHEAAKPLYRNGIRAGILISYAAFHASSKRYSYSCNQAGVVRNAFYFAIMDDKIPFERI